MGVQASVKGDVFGDKSKRSVSEWTIKMFSRSVVRVQTAHPNDVAVDGGMMGGGLEKGGGDDVVELGILNIGGAGDEWSGERGRPLTRPKGV